MTAEQKKKLSLSAKMLIGMVLGVIAGSFIGSDIAVLQPFGTAFVNLLKMTMVPVIFVSITLSVADVDDLKKLGRTGAKIFGVYCVTTVIASVISVGYTSIIQPGVGFTNITAQAVKRAAPSFTDTLLAIIPVNIVDSLAKAQLVSIIFFSVLFGVSLAALGEKKRPVVNVLSTLEASILQMIQYCLKYAPFGVFALMAAMSGKYGIGIISTLGKFLLTDYLGFITQIVVVYGIMLAMCRINLFKFISRSREATITAFSTCSSAAALPIELRIGESHLGVPGRVGRFAFPFGATVNQNGTAINVTACVLFSAQVYGFTFTPAELVTIVGLALISAIGTAGIPAGGSIFTLMILAQFGLPTEAFGMILASYTLVDAGSTTMNIMGDMVTAIFVSDKEGTLDRKVWDEGYVPEAASEQKDAQPDVVAGTAD